MATSTKREIREIVWEKLRRVARPDSRLHWDFSSFIPDYEGSEKCADKLRSMDIYLSSKVVMATPDNNLCRFREYCILDEKIIIMPTGGIVRGFLKISRNTVPLGKEDFASTLDGSERYGEPVALIDIKRLGKIDLMVTGASVVNVEGIRHGKGHGYFDLEWAMFREISVVDEEVPIVAFVHDCQVIKERLPSKPFDTIIDVIITPTRVIRVKKKHRKPLGIIWDKLPKETIDEIPPLKELKKMKGLD